MTATANQSAIAKHILVVEDEQALRDMYVQILQNAGYTVTAAEDGKTAFETMKSNTFNLVLLDIMLPEMDGIQVLEKLTSETEFSTEQTPVVLFTNLGQDQLIAKALTLGVRGYLVKSDYTPDQILTEVQKYIA